MIKSIIFDLDGTLLNTIEDLANACNYALTTLGYKTHEVEKYKTFVGNGRYKLVERMLPEDRRDMENIEKALKLFDTYYEKHMIDMTKPYDGIMEMLDSLINRGINIAVVSNKPHEFTTEVVKNYFGDRFKVVYGHKKNTKEKPDPWAVLEVIEEFNVNKDECLYIGDSEIDINTAKNAGVKSVGVEWGFRGKGELEAAGANYIVNKPEQILEIL
ncbi:MULTISPECIES: HAD family hydrolase [Clostridium]|uniref:HAD-superfamily hydrolase n=1 Tax=Clostridium disporicum TaxID=84024 RepID=A0A174LAD8_9CLOT|nr:MULTISPECIES: HAD family hydrolase [Clostridium]MCD2500572.1 HAD family hydrolase [Clostridium sp. NSJ-145]MDU6340045.1 HAD family hydrolase [Clostridium sp.]CUP21123.1 HAD-superfamily hydrolase [Clostridium disporicum]